MKTLGEQPALPHFKIREEPTITCMHNQVGAVKGNAGSCRHLKIQTANYLLCHLSSNLNFVYKGDKSLRLTTVHSINQCSVCNTFFYPSSSFWSHVVKAALKGNLS